ncbi:MAG: protein arginine kinase [Puniceicoccales bacterium]|jgi:protein arginine kinase|nr:protein arginine kinase [Puniceicoccales bacterium]
MKPDATNACGDEPAQDESARQPIVLSTRVRLARNLNNHVFPERASQTQQQAVVALCAEALRKVPGLEKGVLHCIDKLNTIARNRLVERHLISRELANGKNSAVFISQNSTCSIMINEEDHLRIQIVHRGLQLMRAWEQANKVDCALDGILDIAFSSKYGFLTACPSNLGTGLRASVMLHLPGLVISEQMEKVFRAVNHDGLTVRGWLGEGSEANGSIFQISNQYTLGASEEDILKHLTHWLDEIIRQENNARYNLLGKAPEKFFDQVSRQLALLRHARLISSAEAMGALSMVRFACDVGMLPGIFRFLVDRLLIEVQPAHVLATPQQRASARFRDGKRAAILRKVFGSFPEPNFDILSSGASSQGGKREKVPGKTPSKRKPGKGKA